MAKTTARKQKLSKKAAAAPMPMTDSTLKINKKISKQKKFKRPKAVSHNSDSDSDPNTEIQTLLEPFSKDQLVSLVIELSSSDDHLFSLVKSTSDQDISHRKIFVHGLGWDATSQSVEYAFAAHGDIEDLNVVSDRATGKCKGYAFVTFKSRKSALNLLKTPRFQVGNRSVLCQLASEGPPGPAAAGIVSQRQFLASDYPQRKIYVSNVSRDASPDKLRVFFEKFGEIESGPKGLDPTTGRFRGYAIFVFKTLEGAKKVLEEPNKLFEGSVLNCRKAAESKMAGGCGAASITTALQPVQPEMLAAVAGAQHQQVQNMAVLGQQPGFVNPLYGGLIANANLAALMGGLYGLMGGDVQGLGFGPYGGVDSGAMLQGLQYAHPNLPSKAPGVWGLGAYGVSGGGDSGSSGAMLQGHPNSQTGQMSSPLSKAPVAGGSGHSQGL